MIEVTRGFDAQAWRTLPVTAPMHDPDWLRIMCSRLPGEVHTVRCGDRLAFTGAVVTSPHAYESYNPYAILWRTEPVFDVPDAPQRRERLAALNAGPEMTLPGLVLVAPGYWGDPAGSAVGDARVVKDAVNELRTWCRDQGLASLSALYTVRCTEVLRTAFAANGGISYPLTERWMLPVRWTDWNGYLSGLPRRRSQEVRRELRRAAEAGARPARVDPERHFDAIVEARCTLLEQYGQSADRLAERRRLRGLLDAFGSRVTAYASVRDEDLLAVALCLRLDRALHVVWAGVTQAGLLAPYAHFLANFYAVVQDVTAADTDEIDYGIGHGTGKAMRGCQPVSSFGHTVGTDHHRTDLLLQAGRLLLRTR